MFDLIFVFERIEFEIGVTSRLKNSFILRTFNDSSIKMKIFSISNTPGRKKINYMIRGFVSSPFWSQKACKCTWFFFPRWLVARHLRLFCQFTNSEKSRSAQCLTKVFEYLPQETFMHIWYALYNTFWNINVAKRRVTLISTLIKYETNLKMHIEVTRYFW